MPVFDTPITTDDNALDRVLSQSLPVVLVLYNTPDSALDNALRRVAKEHAGEILTAKVDVNANPNARQRFNNPTTPALVTVDNGEVESHAERILPADIDAHVDFLLGMGPLPMKTAAEEHAKANSGVAPVHVSDASFQKDVLQSDIPTLVDFWAVWCPPCRMIEPILERMAEKYAGQIKIAKLNVDDNPMLAQQYQAMSIPMMLMFKGGQPVGKLVGAHPQRNIEAMIQQAIN
jgi:thioredoxin 1